MQIVLSPWKTAVLKESLLFLLNLSVSSYFLELVHGRVFTMNCLVILISGSRKAASPRDLSVESVGERKIPFRAEGVHPWRLQKVGLASVRWGCIWKAGWACSFPGALRYPGSLSVNPTCLTCLLLTLLSSRVCSLL